MYTFFFFNFWWNGDKNCFSLRLVEAKITSRWKIMFRAKTKCMRERYTTENFLFYVFLFFLFFSFCFLMLFITWAIVPFYTFCTFVCEIVDSCAFLKLTSALRNYMHLISNYQKFFLLFFFILNWKADFIVRNCVTCWCCNQVQKIWEKNYIREINFFITREIF